MRGILGPLADDTRWQATDTPLTGRLAELLADQWDINKLIHYLPVYESALPADRPIRLLEIGVSFGGSLELWRRYLHPDSVVVGVDYNPGCARFDNPAERVHVRIGEQQDTAFLQSVVDEFGPFDVVLDDGSHIPAYTVASFRHLFVNGLVDGGAYLVEDLHTCYSTDCPPPELDDGTPQFTEVIKHLIDVMHAVYTLTPTGDEFSNSFEPDNPGRLPEVTAPLAAQLISSIEIRDAIAVIRRGPRDLPRMIRRWSRERMTAVLSEDAALFLDEHPHLGDADRSRRDWLSGA